MTALDLVATEPADRAFEEAAARRMAPRDGTIVDAGIVAVISILVSGVYAVINPNVIHWYLLPAIVSGSLMGKEVIAWLRGRLDVFDAKAFIGGIGYLFFFLTPLLYVAYNAFASPELPAPQDWRAYLTLLTWMNLVCVLLYLGAHRLGFAGQSHRALSRYWHLPQGVNLVLLGATALSIVSWIAFFILVGGYSGLLRGRWGTPTGAARVGGDRGLRRVRALLLLLALTSLRGTKWYRKSSVTLVLSVIVMMAIAKFVVSGLSGAQERMMWPLLIVVGVVHYFWRPLKPWHLLVGAIPLFLFLHFYVLYKTYGKELLNIFQGVPLSYYTSEARPPIGVLLGDIGRANIQSSELYVLIEHPDTYTLKFGKTYVFALVQPVPGYFWPADRKPWQWSKGYAAFEQAWESSYYHPQATGGAAARQFGLTGESLLNFGLLGPFLAFPVWGFLVGRLRRYCAWMRPGDMRAVNVLFFTNMAFVALPSDFDNVFGVFIWHALFPILVLRSACSRRAPAHEMVDAEPLAAA